MTIIRLNDYRYSTLQNKRRNNTNTNKTIAALDIGNAKTCCVIAKPKMIKEKNKSKNQITEIDVNAIAQFSSRAIRRGKIIDLEDAQNVIAQTVQEAEIQAQKTINDIYVTIAGGYIKQFQYNGKVILNQYPITKNHMKYALKNAWKNVTYFANKTILYAAIEKWTIDKNTYVENPVNMYGETLTVTINIITVNTPMLQNIEAAVERCHLNIAGYVIAPQAAANAVLVTDEKILGTLCIDIGAQLTTLSVFANHNMIFADTIPIGGNDITMDIARGLATPIIHAERMKIIHGTLLHDQQNQHIAAPLVGETGIDTLNHVTKQKLTEIIKPRVSEIFQIVNATLQKNTYAYQIAQRIVITGGASQMTGIREYATQFFKKPTRNATPNIQKNKYINKPEFAAAIGTIYAAINGDIHKKINYGANLYEENKFLKLRKWIKSNF